MGGQAQELLVSLMGQVQVQTKQVLTLTAHLEALWDLLPANSIRFSKSPSAAPPGTLPNRKVKSEKKEAVKLAVTVTGTRIPGEADGRT